MSRPGSRLAARALEALERLAGGLGTAALAVVALAILIITVILIPLGLGVLLLPTTARLTRAVADRERARLLRWGAEGLVTGVPVATTFGHVAHDGSVRREWGWLLWQATVGLVLGLLAILLPLFALRDLTYPLWMRLIPEGEGTPSIPLWIVHDWVGVVGVVLLGIGWTAVLVMVMPFLANDHERIGARLLATTPEQDLSIRVAELTATRAAALDAHANELRRIERALHDGAQNRLVAVTVLLGAARRAVQRDPSAADAILDRAQDAAELALADLRTVARNILPPVLADRGLAGALDGLAASSAVPCRLEIDIPVRCPATVEATAYFVTAEALTNVARHSLASKVLVSAGVKEGLLVLIITDDGAGGADETRGSGLAGIRRRIEALDGEFVVNSPPGGPTVLRAEVPCGS